MSDEIKHMDIAEFRQQGYLQEVNRQFFHPLGLALEVDVAEDGTKRLSGVWDYRDDPEGIYFVDPPDAAKAAAIEDQLIARRAAREAALGYFVQPVEMPRIGGSA